MSCPHSSAPGSRPEACSLCAGATPAIVQLRDGIPVVDGKELRAKADPTTSYRGRPRRKK